MRVYLPFFIALLIGFSGFSQSGETVVISDFETWSKAGLDLKVNKKWTFGLEQQLRLDSNSTELNVYLTEVNAQYKMESGLIVGGGLRFIRDNDNEGKNQGYENHLRFNFDLGYKHSVKRLKLVYRLRLQSKNELGVSEEEGDFASKHLRLKAGGEYNIKKWKFDPKLSVELFHHMQEEENGLSKFRATIATSYDLKKYGDIGMFYRIEQELNPTRVNYPKTTYIIGLSYVYTIKIKNNESSKK